jgi:hypothetical protein
MLLRAGIPNPRHLLLQCPLYIELRKEMLDKIGMGRTVDYDKIISDPKTARYVAEFIHKAGVLGQFREEELTTAGLPEPSRKLDNIGSRCWRRWLHGKYELSRTTEQYTNI